MSGDPVHDGGIEPLPEPEPLAEGQRAVLTAAVVGRGDELEAVLPAGTEVLVQGRAETGEWEVTRAEILRSTVPDAALRSVPNDERGEG